jgi:hypothetical protein
MSKEHFMQISKCFPIVCAVTLAVSSTYVQAADSSAQIKAREALRQKMQELDAQQPATNQPATNQPAPEVKAVPAPTPRVAKPAPPVTAEPPVQPSPSVQTQPRLNTNAQAQAQEALRKKMLELQKQEEEKQQAAVQAAPTPPPAVVQAETPAPAAKQNRNAEQQQNATPEMAETPRPRGAPPEDIERARSAMRRKISDLDREAPLEMAQAGEGKDKRHPYTPKFDPIAGPSSGLSPAKEQQLGQLLTRYQADEITPEQYHAERAKILAQP